MSKDHKKVNGTHIGPPENKIQYPACDRCGSPNVSADAAARWNHELQDWEVTNVFDKGHHCDDCEDECRIKFVAGNPPEEPEMKMKCPGCNDNPDIEYCATCCKGMFG